MELYETCILLGDNSVMKLLDMFDGVLSNEEVKVTDTLATQVNAFLLRVSDHRRLHDSDNINSIEDCICSLFKTWLLKLNENMFRSLLMDLIEWSRQSMNETSTEKDTAVRYDEYDATEDGEGKTPSIHRMIMFYKLINVCVNTLQSIFVPYFSVFMEYCANDLHLLNGSNFEMLANADVEDKKNRKVSKKRKIDEISREFKPEITIGESQHACILLIISALTACFTHDNEGFMQDQSRFNLILQPIVEQLENLNNEEEEESISIDMARYGSRVEAIAQCLAKLATVSSHQLWKPLQLQVLLKTQHKDSTIKCAAINVLNAMYSTVGQEFVAMLPELLPYVAELLEDDDDLVVKETQRLVRAVEDSCGEDLSRYVQ
jgi:U3 small nucleolar RNA-associated protein 10